MLAGRILYCLNDNFGAKIIKKSNLFEILEIRFDLLALIDVTNRRIPLLMDPYRIELEVISVFLIGYCLFPIIQIGHIPTGEIRVDITN